MQAIYSFVQANLPIIGVVAGVAIPAILFLICESREVTTIRKRY